MAKKILTVCGPIEPETLGATSMQDYVFYDGAAECKRLRGEILPSMRSVRFPMNLDDDVAFENVGILQRNAMLSNDALSQTSEEMLTEELRLYKSAGGGAILSLGAACAPPYNGAEIARGASKASGVNVVESAGFGAPGSWPPELKSLGVEGCYKNLTNDIENAPIKPGHLVAHLSRFERDEQNTLRAVVRAAKETGLSATVCLSRNAEGETLGAIESVLTEESAEPARFVLANVPLFSKPALAQALKNPSAIKADTEMAEHWLGLGYNLAVAIPNAMRFELAGDYDCGDFLSFAGLFTLVDKGYSKQLVLGNDCRGKIALHQSGGEGYCRLLYYVVPMIRDTAGVPDHSILQMTIENPARILAV